MSKMDQSAWPLTLVVGLQVEDLIFWTKIFFQSHLHRGIPTKHRFNFAPERGVPALICVMLSKRLPYPSRAFNMAHCSSCLLPWDEFDGLYLIEVDRILRPSGYWILSGPPIGWRKNHRG